MTLSPPVRLVLADLRTRLAGAGITAAALEARRLVELATGRTRLSLLSDDHLPLSADERHCLDVLVARRLSGEPLGRIEGRRGFHGREFALSPGTLEPRPDSEAVVDLALRLMAQDTPRQVLDLGTGTGCLLLTLLAQWPQATGLGIDRSADACHTARTNAMALDLGSRTRILCANWDDALAAEHRFDLVISNPPYIRSSDLAGLAREVREHDPVLALDGGADGLYAYRQLVGRVGRRLTDKGLLVLEVGLGQEHEVTSLAEAVGLSRAGHERDLGGIVRGIAFRQASLR